ncbi:Acetyltransferase (GNAT) family protein [compost metagenome]
MNLLPRLRGQRVGTRLLALWIDKARTSGVTGIHLGASASNTGGIAFWTRSGFAPQREEPGVVWFGMTL